MTEPPPPLTEPAPPATASPHASSHHPAQGARSGNRHFAIGLARAAGGAMLFSLPLLMTMEMWSLGATMAPARLALLLLLAVPLLVGVSHYAGFEETFGWQDDTIDAFVALAVGFAISALILTLFAVISPSMGAGQLVGRIALQAVPASIGALLAHSELSNRQPAEDRKRSRTRHAGEVFLMAVGALFLSFSVAPTEEMVLIAHKMSLVHALSLAALSLAVMHAFVYSVEFKGHGKVKHNAPQWSLFLRFTVTGYAVALLISLYMLWSFGRTQGLAWESTVMATLVVAFPAAIGAAAARLII